ncbi:MAG: endopeptidase La [Clostridiales bacterium]|jgi:ATP-dependent Lon protease|nr:endopeptidase La [Clostridiales bacterium]
MSDILPLIPLRGAILFPNDTRQFDIGRPKSIAAVNFAAEHDRLIIFATQKDDSDKNPDLIDVRNTATVARLINYFPLPNKTYRIIVEGIKRVKIIEKHEDCSDEILSAYYEDVVNAEFDLTEAEACKKQIIELLEEFATFDKNLSDENISALKNESNIDVVINKAATLLSIKDPYPILEETNLIKRAELLAAALIYELEVIKTEKRINIKVKHSLDRSQKEHILREQMKAISDELDGDDDKEILKKAEELDVSPDVKEKLLKEFKKLKKLSINSAEYSIITEYVNFAVELPWNRYSEEICDLEYAKNVLDADHYGLKKVKERILEYIAVHNLTKSFKSPILCFIGPPGVGKTSIAKSIADATGRKFVRMSLGGISDEAEIRGHRKTYVGAMPGRILAGIKNSGVSNPVFLLDEIDKLSKNYRGDPASALLEVLDPEQNVGFRDNYLEVPYDLSGVMFLTTANDADEIPKPLLDRMEVIEMPSYSYGEKFHIAQKHLIAKEMKNCGLTAGDIKIDDDAIYEIINKYTSEAGVRSLERQIAAVMRKTAYNKGIGKSAVTVNAKNLPEYLGNKTVIMQKRRERDEIGTVTGLAWTANGGDILPIEINTVKGKGEIITTGNLKDIIKESIRVALTYVHSVAEKHGIDENIFKEVDFHIHLPENAVPKEGPSAGIGFASAIYSALTRRPVRSNAAMTGEINLRGNVSAVGGIKEKVMAGFRAGIDTFFIPKENLSDIEDIPIEIIKKITVRPIGHFDDVLKSGLVFLGAEKTDRIKSAAKKETLVPKADYIGDILLDGVIPEVRNNRN